MREALPTAHNRGKGFPRSMEDFAYDPSENEGVAFSLCGREGDRAEARALPRGCYHVAATTWQLTCGRIYHVAAYRTRERI